MWEQIWKSIVSNEDLSHSVCWVYILKKLLKTQKSHRNRTCNPCPSNSSKIIRVRICRYRKTNQLFEVIIFVHGVAKSQTQLSNWTTTDDLCRNSELHPQYSNCKTQVTWMLAQCSGGRSDGTVFIHTREASSPQSSWRASHSPLFSPGREPPEKGARGPCSQWAMTFWVNQNFLGKMVRTFFFLIWGSELNLKNIQKSLINTKLDNWEQEEIFSALSFSTTWPEFKSQLGSFTGGIGVRNLPANGGDTGSIPGLGRSHIPRRS